MKKVNVNLNFSIFIVLLKNRNIISKMKRSKVTDYAALNFNVDAEKTLLNLDQVYLNVHYRMGEYMYTKGL